MGVISDYFCAADAENAALAIASGPRDTAFDTVEAKGIDPVVVLGQLIALIRRTPWSPDTVPVRVLWPPPKTEPTSQEAYDKLPENSPWRTGPWLQELSVETRAVLALVDDERLPDLAVQWARIEEMSRFGDVSSLLPLLKELVDLARKAHKDGDQLYCWICL